MFMCKIKFRHYLLFDQNVDEQEKYICGMMFLTMISRSFTIFSTFQFHFIEELNPENTFVRSRLYQTPKL